MDMMPFEPTPTPEPKRRGRFVSWLAASVAGAVIGSAATWYVAPKWMHEETNSQTETAETTAKSEALPLQPTANVNTNMIAAINKVADAVVGVVNIQKQVDFFSDQAQDTEAGTGSGVIFKKDGDAAYIVTNNHVIEGANKVEVALANGKKVKAEIVGADALTDLAVLKIPAEGATKVASFGDSSKVKIGEPVAAIGNPLGLDLSRTVTEGIVSGKRTMPVSTSAGDWEIDVIQTDAAINPGNSGGALINSAGQVIGINSMKIAETGVEGLGFAIPSENVKPIVEQLMKDGKIKRPYLGVQLVDVADLSDDVRTNELKLPSNITSGAAVTSVEPFSPAAEAGLKSKDVITAINGEKIDSVSALRKYLYTKTAVGDRIKLTIYRDGFETTVSVTLKARDSSQS
ncbi:Serine protease Do-like HtrB [Geobacillus stearothermophilus]|uniref:S1C family serine protease n=1 Tax=Geobacillus sp. DSP4a TaxID=2508873 RepID=UPI00067D33B7|nr:trypsin-like peptidase domain-containing protein [Geobacillus sp. DSP4a]AKU27031.1 peptidase S1 [Geobacillus sp. LC300]KZE96922.1 Serine protease Do-like HtrB [Geobacillus stearothermophilus]NNV00139.1 PDZ domain-containing protein [Geobacillus sp. DSP4a]